MFNAHRITSTSDVDTIYEEAAEDFLIDEEAAGLKDNQETVKLAELNPYLCVESRVIPTYYIVFTLIYVEY